ncbi:tellurium resistance protein [bacterium]|nr:tellurium resistance protein [bacterium]
MGKRPGGELATRPLHFIWIADCSGSMQADGKIQTLNEAVREAIPHMRKAADENPNARVLVRAVAFSDEVGWPISDPTPVENFSWVDLQAKGISSMGKAFESISLRLKSPPMDQRALPPVLVLISDGYPTDDFDEGLRLLLSEPWGKKSIRMAIAIGEDADQEVLEKFIDNPQIKPLHANNPESLVKYIKWASTSVLKAVSAPMTPSSEKTSESFNILIPVPPDVEPNNSNHPDVW